MSTPSAPFVLTQKMGHDLESVFQKEGGTLEDFEWLKAGGNIDLIRRLRMGQATLVPVATSSVIDPLTADSEGNYHFTLISNGFTPTEWAEYFYRLDRILDWPYKTLLRLEGLVAQGKFPKAEAKGSVHNIVVRPGVSIRHTDLKLPKIREYAHVRKWKRPHWEVACLMSNALTNDQLDRMKLQHIVTVHEPIKDPHMSLVLNSASVLLGPHRGKYDRPTLDAQSGKEDALFVIGNGFAFEEDLKAA